MKDSPAEGLLVIDKPAGLTSRSAVDRVLRGFPRGTRLGHTGTLDPLATGVLVLCLGRATRLTEHVQAMRKTYRSRFLLGAQSDTDDADGTVTPLAGATAPEAESVTACLAEYVGTIQQVPPAYSAARVTGQRAYDRARRGEEVVLRPRPVCIHAISVLHYAYPHLDVEVQCGKGTYIRALARDAGARLGSGALVQTLRRTRVGPFTLEDALPLDADAATLRAALLPIERAVAELPRVTLPEGDLLRLGRGQAIKPVAGPASLVRESDVAVFDAANHLAVVARVDADGFVRPVKVLRSF
jgi:tRNA pseudouridine55 synthase